MTTLDLLGGDWKISFDDEKVNPQSGQAGLRMLEYISGPVRTTNEVYSDFAANSDFFQAMTFKNGMTPTTPNAYVMANDYFISRTSTEFLKEGALNAAWSMKTVGADSDTAGHGVLKVAYSGGTNFNAGDIGRRVTQGDSGDEGTLLEFDLDPDGTTVAWIRPDDSTPSTGDTFDGTGTLVALAGTGSTTNSTPGVSGDTQFSAIQAIGAVPTATEVYVIQNRVKLADAATGTFQWWDTDQDVSLGIISILVMVQDSGSLIADADLEVFARRYTALYDNFQLNVAAGGFQALPLASSPDLNNTTGYRTTGTLTGVTGTFNVGNGIYVGGTWDTATVKGVITETNGNTDLEYYLVGDLTDFSNTQAIQEYDFVLAADGDADATTGTVADNLTGPTDGASGEGATVTLALGPVTNVDFDGDGAFENYSITVDAQSDVGFGKVYERFKYVTRRGADAADLFGAGTNVPGETFRGLEGTFEYDANTGAMVDGDDVSITARSGFSARMVAQLDTPADSVDTHITLMDIQTSLTSSQPANDDLISGEGGDGVEDITVHGAGTLGIQRFTVSKQSPLGTSTGTAVFLTRGVIIINPASADTQAYTATPNNSATPLNPPNTISIGFSNTRAGDRLMIARDDGTAGVIDRDKYGGIEAPGGAFNSQDDVIIRVAGTIDSEVVLASVVRIVETTLLEEHRYYYDSVTKVSNGEFSLTVPTSATGTATSSSSTQLIDTGQSFDGATPVEVGMMIRNTFGGKTTHVWEVTEVVDSETLNVRALYGGADDWDSGDTYIINALIQTYATGDNLFDLILDVEEDIGTDGSPGVEGNTLIKITSSPWDVAATARQGKVILPFEINQAVGDNSVTITVVRQDDTIAT